ncbi:MAG TPA: hypothetical protein VNZ64_25610 [Candidatus Acidoferrum sp.]|nr:hypothetical protein [Candidatus Acidoferrum sp.]
MKTNRFQCIAWALTMGLVSGCSMLPGRVSDRAWSQTAEQERRQEEVSSAPPGEWPVMPRDETIGR